MRGFTNVAAPVSTEKVKLHVRVEYKKIRENEIGEAASMDLGAGHGRAVT